MNAGWMAFGVGLAVVAIMLAVSWLRRHDDVDLGSVSHQWIAEQRHGQEHHPQR